MPFEYRSDALVRSLASLHQEAPAILGSAILTQDGLVVVSYPPGWEGDIHDPTGGENVAAMAAVVAGLAERTMARLDLGQLERVLMEGERGTVAVFAATSDTALALLIDKDAKLGVTLTAARHALNHIRAILSDQ